MGGVDSNVALAFFLTLLAGLATGIGSTIAFIARRTNSKFLAVSLGFSAGVMIYVSLVELVPQVCTSLSSELGQRSGHWAAIDAFFGGILLLL